MDSMRKIYTYVTIMVISILIIGIYLGYTYSGIGESAHTIISSHPTIQAVKSVSNDDLKLLFTIWIINSFAGLCLILLSYLKKFSSYMKYSIYFGTAYQFITISLLIGYALHVMSAKMIAVSLIPHGIVEIPIILLATTYGIYLCQSEVKDTFKTVMKNYALWILIPLFGAALLETFVTPYLMSIV